MKVVEAFSKIMKDYSGIIKPCRDFAKCSFTHVLCGVTACSFSAATSADRFYRIDKAQVFLTLLLLQNSQSLFPGAFSSSRSFFLSWFSGGLGVLF